MVRGVQTHHEQRARDVMFEALIYGVIIVAVSVFISVLMGGFFVFLIHRVTVWFMS